MDLEIAHDPDRSRFEARVGSQVAYLAYREVGPRTLDYRHTFVPPELRERQMGRRLARHALDWAREHGYRVVPSCSFVQRVIEEGW